MLTMSRKPVCGNNAKKDKPDWVIAARKEAVRYREEKEKRMIRGIIAAIRRNR